MILAPSLLSADVSHLHDELLKAERMGAKYIHIDIMDGIFVPNKTWDASFMEGLEGTSLYKDVHIMVADPKRWAMDFAKAGADNVTFHIEACTDYEKACEIADLLHKRGVSAGISIKPLTPVGDILPLLSHFDMVLVMSVEPGKGGQSFIESSLEKIAALRREIDEKGYKCLIEVDGGINGETGPRCLKAGADILVSGSYLFGHDDYMERARSLFEE